MLPTIAATRVSQFVSILFSLLRNFELVAESGDMGLVFIAG
jgi:hypothetical protein